MNLEDINNLPSTALTGAEQVRIAEILGVQTKVIANRIVGLSAEQIQGIRSDLADWELIQPNTTKIVGEVEFDPEKDRGMIRSRLKGRLGFSPTPFPGVTPMTGSPTTHSRVKGT